MLKPVWWVITSFTAITHKQELQIGSLFNSIYILVGVTFDWENYYSPDILKLVFE